MDGSADHSGDELLREVWEFSLLEALFGRRARRFGLGMEIPSGPLAFTSRHAPLPLSAFERDLLIAVATGVTGWNFGIPFTPTESPGGCSYAVRFTGRTFPSGAAIHTGELFFTDDTGTYLVKSRDLRPLRVREVEGMGDTEHVLAVKGSVKPYSEEFVAALGEMAQYVYETYGRFPATLPTMVLRIVVQVQHIDTEFYDAHFEKGAYLDTHVRHMERWHGERREG